MKPRRTRRTRNEPIGYALSDISWYSNEENPIATRLGFPSHCAVAFARSTDKAYDIERQWQFADDEAQISRLVIAMLLWR